MSTIAPRHHRHRALAELDRLIARAEEARTRSIASAVAEAATVAAGGIAADRAATILGLVDERLATLRRSRAALLADEAR